MSARLYGPDEPWPSSGFPSHFRDVMNEAKAAGWSLKHIDAPHRFGVMICPAGEGHPQVHTFEIDRTAVGSETKAIEARKKVRGKCPHSRVVSESKVASRKAECERLLSTAEALIGGVEQDLPLAEQHQEAVRVFESLDLRLRTAAVTVDEALSESDVSEQVDEALVSVYTTEGAPAGEDLAGVLDDADSSVEKATGVATRLSKNSRGVARPYLARATAAKTRIAGLRDRLDALMKGCDAADYINVGFSQHPG